MIRIKFEFENISPFLRRIDGILHVEEVDDQRISKPPVELFRCKFHRDDFSIGFTSFDDEPIPSNLFNCLSPLLKSKIYSYWSGMIMKDIDYEWIPMKGDDSWECFQHLDQEVGGYIQNLTNDGEKKDEVISWEDSSCPQKLKSP